MRRTLEAILDADPTLDPHHGADPDASNWQPLSGAPAKNRAATSDLAGCMSLEPSTPRLDTTGPGRMHQVTPNSSALAEANAAPLLETTGQGRMHQGAPNSSEFAEANAAPRLETAGQGIVQQGTQNSSESAEANAVSRSSSVTPRGRGIEPSNHQTAGVASTTESVEHDEEKGNDAWMKFGMAALGVVVGGVVLSLQGGGSESDRDSSERQNEGRGNTSSVQIEELSDDGDDEWVSVPNSNPQ
jgi:hypothetical protein